MKKNHSVIKVILSDQLDDQNLRSHYSSYTPQPPSIKTSHYHTTQVNSRHMTSTNALQVADFVANFEGTFGYSYI